MCKSIGIDSPDPSEWVEKMKVVESNAIEFKRHEKYWIEKVDQLQAENEALQAMREDYARLTANSIIIQSENEAFKAKEAKRNKAINIILSSIEGSLNGIEDGKGDSDVVGISGVVSTLNELFTNINKLKGE